MTRDPGPVAAAAERVRDRAATVGVVDGATTVDKASVLGALATALSFPSWYGGNLDALEDCLRDLAWLPAGLTVLVWDDGPLRDADPDTHRTVLEIFRGAEEAQAGGPRPLEVVLVG